MDKTFGFYIFVFCCKLLSACDPGWFGSGCQYKCHCVTSCDGNGECLPGSSCAIGWFGPLCQYQDLAQLGSTTTTSLTDGNDSTCVSLNNFTISWSIRYEVTSLRVTFQTYDSVSDISLAVKESNSTSSFTPCTNQTMSTVKEFTTDIYCSYNTTVQVVTIDFGKLRSVCTVNVNGGRNIALNQPTWQSGDYVYEGIPYVSSRAVDGNTDRNALKNSCTQTLVGLPGTWKVTFPASFNVNRYILYNRDNYKTYLSNFTLISYSSSNKPVFNYTDPNTVVDVCIVTSLSTPSVSYVQINVKDALMLCEVEIFEGCAIGWFGPGCQNKCHCTDHYCDDSDCNDKFYGENCRHQCSINCTDQLCDKESGTCFSCISGQMGEYCQIACDTSHYGPNCVNNCSSNCNNSVCEATTGQCFTCVQGYRGNYCEIVCPIGYYGENCQYTESRQHKSCTAHDRLAEGIGIGIGIMCFVNVILVLIVCIFVKTKRSVTSKTKSGNKTNKEGETQDNNISIQPDYTDLSSASAVADTNHYDYINGNMGPYDTLNNDFKETSQYEAVSMATLKNRK